MRSSNKPRGHSVSLVPRAAPVKGATVTTFANAKKRIEGMSNILSNIGEEVKGEEEEEKKGQPAQPLIIKQTVVNNAAKKPNQQTLIQKTT